MEELIGDTVQMVVPSAVDIDTADDEQALNMVVDCERAVAFLHATQAQALARLATHRPPVTDSRFDRPELFDRFVADEVSAAVGWSRVQARTRLAHAVDQCRRLPVVLAALGSGGVDVGQAGMFCDTTSCLDDDDARDVAERVLATAPASATGETGGVGSRRTNTQLRRELNRHVAQVDPGGEHRRHENAVRERRVELIPGFDGMADLVAHLPAVEAVAIWETLDQAARTLPATDERGMDQRRADLLADHVLGPPATRPVPRLVITVPAATLTGDSDDPAELAGYGPITATAARDLTAASTDITTQVHPGYRPPAALDRYIRLRDGTCRFPTCTRTAGRCDLDHTVPHPEGPTTAGNLGALCRVHHRMKHERRWRLSQRDGLFTWTSPTGRTHTQHPDPLP